MLPPPEKPGSSIAPTSLAMCRPLRWKGQASLVRMRGGLGIRFSSTEYVAGTIITHELENLDADFNLADYPLYFFGLKDTSDLPPEVAKPFDNSREEMKSSMNDPPIDTLKIDGATVYIACSPHCEALVVQESQAEQILHLTSRGLGQNELVSILTGHQHAAE